MIRSRPLAALVAVPAVDHTAPSTREVTTEVHRHISWSDQALGSRSDIRQFHDAMLAPGSVPLPVLELALDAPIANGGRGPYAVEPLPAGE